MQQSWSATSRLNDPVGQGRLDGVTGLKDTVYADRRDDFRRQLGGNVFGQTQHAHDGDADALALLLQPLQKPAVVMQDADNVGVARDRLLDFELVLVELRADGTANKVGTVRIKAFPNQKVDLPQLDGPHVD